MTRRMRALRRELVLDCEPDSRTEETLYWVPLTEVGRIALMNRQGLLEVREEAAS